MELKNIRNLLIAPLIATSCFLKASTVTIPNEFTANTTAVAAEVNANFDAVKLSVDDNDTRIDDLMAAVAQLQADLATASDEITTLESFIAMNAASINSHESRIDIIEENTVLDLDNYLVLSTINGYDTAEFTDINVQINNGSNSTGGIVNGLGNLTIGYNETNASAQDFCSNPNEPTELGCTSNGGDWLSNARSGSHNLILGTQNSYTSFSGIVAGQDNVSNSLFSTVLGGRNNRVDTEWSVIVGGRANIVRPNLTTGPYSSILGGYQNVVFGTYSTISGGQSNTASSFYSSVSGGQSNTASGDHSSVSGGDTRSSTGTHDWRAGGLFETN